MRWICILLLLVLARPCWSQEVTLKGHTGRITSLSFSADCTKLTTTSHDGTGRIWSTTTGIQLAICKGHQGPVRCGVLRVDGQRFVTADDETVRFWDSQTGKEAQPAWETRGIYSLALTDNGRIVAVDGVIGDGRPYCKSYVQLLSVATAKERLRSCSKSPTQPP
jgi:WD40 repeat protein